MSFGVEFGRFASMVSREVMMAVRGVSMMTGLLVIAFIVMPCRFFVVPGCVLVVLCGMAMVVGCFLRHADFSFCGSCWSGSPLQD